MENPNHNILLRTHHWRISSGLCPILTLKDNTTSKGALQKLLSGFFPLRGGALLAVEPAVSHMLSWRKEPASEPLHRRHISDPFETPSLSLWATFLAPSQSRPTTASTRSSTSPLPCFRASRGSFLSSDWPQAWVPSALQDNLCVRASFLCIPILFQLQNHSVIITNIIFWATCLHDLQTTRQPSSTTLTT